MEKMISLAKRIQKVFPNFYLAGGTAIMFKYNHRKSIDLDFFSSRDFSKNRMISRVRKNFNMTSYDIPGDNIDFLIENLKVSFLFFPFKNVYPLETIMEINIPQDYDLFLNKIYVSGRRINWKDPFDAAYLLKKHNWEIKSVKRDFEKKFPSQSFEIYLGAMVNFEDYPELPDWVKETLERWVDREF